MILVPYIQENFAHTWHIAVFLNNENEREKKLAKIEKAQALLENGTSMYELIGSEYNEDVTLDYLSDAYGYYFPRGTMDKKYEDAAFGMNVGDNVIVESKAENGSLGHAENYCEVQVNTPNLSGEIRNVEITAYEGGVLLGKIC